MQSGTIIVTGQIETSYDGIDFVSGDTITNTSYIYGRVHDLNEENYISESPEFTVLDPDIYSDLIVNKVNTASTGLIGSTYTYIINYTNSGDSSVSGVSIEDTLPAGFVFVSSSPAPASVSGSDVRWNIGTLAAMQSGRVFLTGIISPSLSSGDILTNTATIDGYVLDTNNNNNNSTTSPVTLFDTIVPSDLIITKTISGSLSNVRIGSLIPYVIHYINSGSSAMSGVVIRDLLMTGLTIPDYDAAIPAPTIFTGLRDITWQLGTLAPMQSGYILLYAFVSGPFTS